MSVAVMAVSADERAEVEAFYRRELGRDIQLGDDEAVLAARDGPTVVAALRLFPEAGTLVLRTVVVAQDRRGQGRECWCFPWSYLEDFYAEIGLARVLDASVPQTLRHHRQGPDGIATYRVAT